jgi:hypothetical protein
VSSFARPPSTLRPASAGGALPSVGAKFWIVSVKVAVTGGIGGKSTVPENPFELGSGAVVGVPSETFCVVVALKSADCPVLSGGGFAVPP